MDNFRTFFIFGLLIVSLLLWEAWQNDYVRPQQLAQQAVNDAVSAPDESLPAIEVVTENQQDLPDMPVVHSLDSLPAIDQVANMSSANQIHVKTDLIDVIIDTKGGDIRSLSLLEYPVESEEPDVPVQFLSETASHYFVVQSGLRSDSSAPTHYDQYHAESSAYELLDGQNTVVVPLTWISDEGLKVTKTYRFHRDSYLIDVDYDVENNSGERFSAYPYAQFNRNRPQEDSGFIYTYTGAVFSTKGNEYEKIDFDDLDDSAFSRTENGGWAAMIQHYFVAAMIPADSEQENSFYGKSINERNYTAGMKLPTVSIANGDIATTSYQMYLGPKQHQRLESVAENLDLTVDFGKLTIISQPLFTIMEWIHKLTNNWGWSIVFLTILIKAAFYRLSAKSYASMAGMRKLTPKLTALKERHGDDKQAFNKGMMDLYRTEKINPLGGCLPILVQMPVFLAFYWVLVEAIELRQAPFIFWLQDLTAMDPYFILPVLFGLSMFFQQKLNPAPQDPAQAMVMKAFPIIFTVFFAFFPSGLVLYWVVNNLLSIAQQWHITRKLGAL
ncbi:MAG: membrane protein insertase YidC [Gammaproteobacteria bacterium]|nr:membrane protein insertase YidC [Gammaproteobacteria bacterium]